jgi:alpha-1,2-mannosyltransferase
VKVTSAKVLQRNDKRIYQVLLIALAVTPIIFLLTSGGLDLKVYRTGGYAWLHDVRLYSEAFGKMVPGIALPFTYPPLAAILFVPLHLLPYPLALLAMCVASTAALSATMVLVAHRLYGPTRQATMAGLLVVVLGLAFEPVRSTIGFGQINLILMGLVSLDCLLPRTRWPRGVQVGLAAAIKLTPAVFVLYFLVRRQFREAAVALGTFAGLAWWATCSRRPTPRSTGSGCFSILTGSVVRPTRSTSASRRCSSRRWPPARCGPSAGSGWCWRPVC